MPLAMAVITSSEEGGTERLAVPCVTGSVKCASARAGQCTDAREGHSTQSRVETNGAPHLVVAVGRETTRDEEPLYHCHHSQRQPICGDNTFTEFAKLASCGGKSKRISSQQPPPPLSVCSVCINAQKRPDTEHDFFGCWQYIKTCPCMHSKLLRLEARRDPFLLFL